MNKLELFKLFFHLFILLSVKSVIFCLAFSYAALELLFKCVVRMAFTLAIVGFSDQKFYKPHYSLITFSANNSVFDDGSFGIFLGMQWSKKWSR